MLQGKTSNHKVSDNLGKRGTPDGRRRRKRTAGGSSKSKKNKGEAGKCGGPTDEWGQQQRRPWQLSASAGKYQSSHGEAIARVEQSRISQEVTSEPREDREAGPKLGKTVETDNVAQHPRVEAECEEEGNVKLIPRSEGESWELVPRAGNPRPGRALEEKDYGRQSQWD
eukprot:scaffold24935_cov93-Cylindrotheca_fusiformis.AAC.2